MRNVVAVGLMAMFLASCTNSPEPPSPRAIAAEYLSKNGYRVVDLVEIGSLTKDDRGNTGIDPPATICLSAPWGGAYRAFLPDGRTSIGVVCVEQDNSVTMPLQKTLG